LQGKAMVPSKIKGVVGSLPRQTPLGPVSGLWGKVQLGPEQVWVHKRFHKDVAAANAFIMQARVG
jgi:hypothetical protein